MAMISQDQLRQALGAFEDPLERRMAFAALLTTALVALGYPPPVVEGGYAVEFYTSGGYTTMDLDLVSSSDALDRVLGTWGFRKMGRHWVHDDLALAVEAPGSRLEGERDRATVVAIAGGEAYVIGIEDLIVDRVCAYVNWGSLNDAKWASILLEANSSRPDRDYLRRRGELYGISDAIGRLIEGRAL